MRTQEFDLEQFRQRMRRRLWRRPPIFGAAYPILLGLASWQLWQASSAGRAQDWQEFWWILWIVWGAAVVFLLLLPPAFVRTWADRPEVSETLEQAVLEGDTLVAPLATAQPAPLESNDLPTEAVDFGPFPPPVLPPTGSIIFPGLPPVLGRLFLPTMLVTELAVVVSVVVLNWRALYEWLLARPVFAAAAATSVLAFAALLLHTAAGSLLMVRVRPLIRLLRQGVRLVADDAGLQLSFVGQGRWQRNIPWQGARVFCMVRLPQTMSIIQGTCYMLGTGERVLTWWITPATTAAALADHERLCRLIVMRTGLPLRDVSALMADLARSPFRARAPALAARIAGTMDQAALNGRRRKRTLIAVALAPIVLAALLSTAGLVLQHLRTG